MTVCQSAQHFVRALKAPSDPPVLGGLLKIDIAEQAWHDATFQLPNKAELVTNWLLSKFFRERGNASLSNDLANERYWKLLCDVLSSNEPKAQNVSLMNSWLKPILNQIAIAPIVVAFLDLWNQLKATPSSRLMAHASYCVSILYPLGTQKITTEALLETWGTFLKNGDRYMDNPHAIRIGIILTKAYRDSLSNSPNRRKVNTLFVQNNVYFEAWLERLSQKSSVAQYDNLRHAILSSGVETVFNIDTLRQISENPDKTPLFNALNSSLQKHRAALLKSLPQLLTHYVSSLKKYRLVLIGSSVSSSQVNTQAVFEIASMRFFTSCQNIVDYQTRDVAAWNAIEALTEIVGRLGLYRSEIDISLSLKQNVDTSLEYLSQSWTNKQLETTTAIARCLSATIRIDYDLILPSMSQLLSTLLTISQVHQDHFTLLDLLLEYHIKTRTISQYIDLLLSCLSLKPTSSPTSSQERYAISQSSPLLHPRHLERLAKATQQFLTPSQCHSTAMLVCETLKSLKDQYKSAERQRDADFGKGSRKALKSDAVAVDRSEPATLALTFALSSKLAQTILGFLPMVSVPQVQAGQLKGIIARFQTEFVQSSLSKLLKGFVKEDDEIDKGKSSKRKKAGEDSTWGSQLVLLSLLRLRYALRMARSLGLPVSDSSKFTRRLLAIMGRFEDEFLPELSLEIFRAVVNQAGTMNETEVRETIDRALSFLDRRFSPNLDVAWSGHAHDLIFGEAGRARSGLAVLHLLLERCLPVIDMVASAEQLEVFARIITRIPLNSTILAGQHLVASHLLLRALRSAQFWELHNLRSSLLAHLGTITSPWDQERATMESPPKKSEKRLTHANAVDVEGVVSTYRLLLFFPVEYFSKSCRAELVKRAIKADWAISQSDNGTSGSDVGLSVIRTFLKRTFAFLGSIEQQTMSDIADFSLHLLENTPSIGSQPEYTQTTLDLCDLYIMELFKQSIRGDAGEASRVLSAFLQYPIFDDLSSVKAKYLVSLVKLLNKEFTFSSFPAEVQTEFHILHSQLVQTLQQRVEIMVCSLEAGPLDSIPPVLTYWHALLSLGQWLRVESLAGYFGKDLWSKFGLQFFQAQQGLASGWLDEIAVMVVGILLQELRYIDEARLNSQLDLIVASYMSYRRVLSSSGQTKVDNFVSHSCRQFSPTSFEYVLGLAEEALSTNSGASVVSTDLVHLGAVLLRDHPMNTLKIMQAFFTRCLDVFANNEEFVIGPVDLRLQTLDYIAQHCSERPAALRSLDIGSIWSLLSKYLSPSAKHDKVTTTCVFHRIIAIVSAIIRLRHDLATPMLPHLGMILRQLILSMRQCRPQLASKQTEMVLSTLPKWISASRSLGVDEARSLSRVLETLTIKTVTHTHMTTSISHKAESLATPFSKHSAYVLKAYIEAMNDPLCVLTLDVRKELYPGLYALCSMIGEHSRDAMMVSALDAGGKAIIKTLWKEYEKQRYVGKG